MELAIAIIGLLTMGLMALLGMVKASHDKMEDVQNKSIIEHEKRLAKLEKVDVDEQLKVVKEEIKLFKKEYYNDPDKKSEGARDV